MAQAAVLVALAACLVALRLFDREGGWLLQ